MNERPQMTLEEALAKLAAVEGEMEKLRLHAAAFPGKSDWVGEHLQKWIQSKDDRAAQSEKIAHQALDEKLAALARAEQSEALLSKVLNTDHSPMCFRTKPDPACDKCEAIRQSFAHLTPKANP